MEIKKFGSLIIRSKPVLPGRMYYRYKDHPTITLGPVLPAMRSNGWSTMGC